MNSPYSPDEWRLNLALGIFYIVFTVSGQFDMFLDPYIPVIRI